MRIQVFPEGQKRKPDLLRLELQEDISWLTRVLRAEPGSTVRTVKPLRHLSSPKL